MKITLQWRKEGLAPSVVHVAGPLIRIGRNPELECVVPESMGKGVSWHHATIEMTGAGAWVSDAGSSNGTYLNASEEPIEPGTPVPLKPGDRLGLGKAGPTLSVLTMSDAADGSSAQSGPKSTLLVAGLAGGAVLLVLVLLGAWAMFGRGRDEPVVDATRIASADAPRKEATPATPATRRDGESAKPGESAKKPDENKKASTSPPPPTPTPPPGVEEAVELGQFEAVPDRAPGVLLQRGGAGQTWTVLRAVEEKSRGDRIVSENELVSLPGYVNTIGLDTGVALELWGNLPEFAVFPPVRASSVILHKPGPGLQADVTLLGGRLVLLNRRNQPATIRLSFHREAWTVTLPDDKSRVAVEGLTLPAPTGANGNPVRVCWFFSQGPAQLRLGNRTFSLPASGHLAWSETDGPSPPSTLPQLPPWWTNPPTAKSSTPLVVETLAHLDQWEKYLSSSGTNVADTIRTRLKERDQDTDFARFRAIGLQFYAAINQEVLASSFLDDRHARVRDAAGDVLRVWLKQSPRHDAILAEYLKANGVGEDKAKLLITLLRGFNDQDLRSRQTVDRLLDLLDHDNLEIRHLALFHLLQIAPKGAEDVRYDPADDDRARREAGIKAWRELMKSR